MEELDYISLMSPLYLPISRQVREEEMEELEQLQAANRNRNRNSNPDPNPKPNLNPNTNTKPNPSPDPNPNQGLCKFAVRGGLADKEGKTNVLMQAYIIRAPLKAFALVSDTMFIAQSASRLARGLPLPLPLIWTLIYPYP